MPENTVSVCRPGPWGNPFKVGAVCTETPEKAVAMFRKWLSDDRDGRLLALAAKRELRGKNLACWCRPGTPCHADVLLDLANADAQAPKAAPKDL